MNGPPDEDKVFKALADPTRRRLLDRLHEQNGQTLGELCGPVAMSRQAATQHLAILEAANLVAVVWRGREKLHSLNPVPLHEIGQHWIGKFGRPRPRPAEAIEQRAEQTMARHLDYGYVIYIESSPETVWAALTDAETTARYWGHSNVSDWQPGSPWEHRRIDGSGTADVVGTVVESVPPRRLVATWAEPSAPDATSRVVFEITPRGSIAQLAVTHEGLADEEELRAVSGGWPAVLSNLKSLLETGSPLSSEPWGHLGEADGAARELFCAAEPRHG